MMSIARSFAPDCTRMRATWYRTYGPVVASSAVSRIFSDRSASTIASSLRPISASERPRSSCSCASSG